jgi:hypothetical protein
MLEEALPIAIGVGAALLPAMAFGGLAAARAFIYLGAGDSLFEYCLSLARLGALDFWQHVFRAVEQMQQQQQQQQPCSSKGLHLLWHS